MSDDVFKPRREPARGAGRRGLVGSTAARRPMQGVTLEPFRCERDLTLVSTWLRQPHVARWWGESTQVLAELARRGPDTASLVLLAGQPVGIVCWQTPARRELEAAGLADLPADLIDVDIVIGEPRALGQGVGPAALLRLFEGLQGLGVTRVGLATSLANTRALAAFAKAGLRPFRDFVEGQERYRYFTKRLNCGG